MKKETLIGIMLLKAAAMAVVHWCNRHLGETNKFQMLIEIRKGGQHEKND